MEYYKALQEHYEKILDQFGPNSRGMDWPNPNDLEKRFGVLTDVIKFDGNEKKTILDLGCGAGLLVNFFNDKRVYELVDYLGVDISDKMIKAAKELHPNCAFDVRDVLVSPFDEGKFDYVIMNGLLTEKQTMSQEQMIEFAQSIIKNAYKSCSKGIAFNIMSSHVDWKRDDLFHWELDEIVGFMVKNCSRKIKIMMNYDLYEYTVHLFK